MEVEFCGMGRGRHRGEEERGVWGGETGDKVELKVEGEVGEGGNRHVWPMSVRSKRKGRIAKAKADRESGVNCCLCVFILIVVVSKCKNVRNGSLWGD